MDNTVRELAEKTRQRAHERRQGGFYQEFGLASPTPQAMRYIAALPQWGTTVHNPDSQGFVIDVDGLDTVPLG